METVIKAEAIKGVWRCFAASRRSQHELCNVPSSIMSVKGAKGREKLSYVYEKQRHVLQIQMLCCSSSDSASDVSQSQCSSLAVDERGKTTLRKMSRYFINELKWFVCIHEKGKRRKWKPGKSKEKRFRCKQEVCFWWAKNCEKCVFSSLWANVRLRWRISSSL